MRFPKVRGLQFNQLGRAARLTVPGAIASSATRSQRKVALNLLQAAQAVSGTLGARTMPMSRSPYDQLLRKRAFPMGLGDSTWGNVLQNFVGEVGTGLVGKVLGRAPAPVTNIIHRAPEMNMTTKVMIGAAIAAPILYLVLRK